MTSQNLYVFYEALGMMSLTICVMGYKNVHMVMECSRSGYILCRSFDDLAFSISKLVL